MKAGFRKTLHELSKTDDSLSWLADGNQYPNPDAAIHAIRWHIVDLRHQISMAEGAVAELMNYQDDEHFASCDERRQNV